MALSNSQYDAVMRRYDEIRERNRYALNGRTERVYAEIPQIMHLDDETAYRSMEAAKMRVADPHADLTSYKNELKRISGEKKLLLIKSGYPADYLEPVYDCPFCRDTGLLEGRRCRCFSRVAAETLYGNPDLLEKLRNENFDHFSFEWYSDVPEGASSPRSAAVEAVRQAHELVDSLDADRRSMYICGSTGTGKTFLAHCIADAAIKSGHSVLYFSSGRFFDILVDAEFSRQGSQTAGRDLISSVELLIIDDLGTELTNSLTSSAFFRIINERIAAGLSTVISTNLSLGDLSQKYSERIFSRISSEYAIVRMKGDDIRIQKKLTAAAAAHTSHGPAGSEDHL
ncbi:MAG: ATP-binding protein [Lachnospiraceae bacterium]|nr:ATP-binding protein [Lachnospiraceae bacterium]